MRQLADNGASFIFWSTLSSFRWWAAIASSLLWQNHKQDQEKMDESFRMYCLRYHCSQDYELDFNANSFLNLKAMKSFSNNLNTLIKSRIKCVERCLCVSLKISHYIEITRHLLTKEIFTFANIDKRFSLIWTFSLQFNFEFIWVTCFQGHLTSSGSSKVRPLD